MKATDAAWLAGLIDGEGYIDVPRLRIKITNCDLRLLKQCQKVAGCGNIYSNGNPRDVRHRQAFRLNIAAKADVRRVLRAVQKRLITKRSKCRLVLGGKA